MIPGNEPIDLPLNQASDDGLCRCWHSDVADTIDILGAPSLQLEISSDQPVATLCARLVDVFPDGKATLISIGTENCIRVVMHAYFFFFREYIWR